METPTEKERNAGSLATILFWSILIGLLMVSSLYSYLLFHSLVEILIVIFAMATFIVGWSARKQLENNYLLVAGIGFLFVGLTTVFHLLTFKGMGVFDSLDTNVPTQLWLASRYLLVGTLLAAPFLMKRKVNVALAVATYVAATAILGGSILFGVFPTAYVEGSGLTQFKIVSEYVLAALLVLAAYLLFRFRASFRQRTYYLLSAFVLINVGAELLFTTYFSVYDLANLLGHLFAATAFFVMFLALAAEAYADPVRVLFSNLENSERKFRTIFEQAGSAILVWSSEKRIIDANRMAVELLGYKREELVGMSLDTLMPPEHAAALGNSVATSPPEP